jgi:hypothetical protein
VEGFSRLAQERGFETGIHAAGLARGLP